MNNNVAILLLTFSIIIVVPAYQTAFAIDVEEKLDFAGGLEEALGHFWALELNLDKNNAELAEIHATHPIAELYTSMKPHLQAADPAFDVRFKTALMELASKATPDVPRAEANAAIDNVRDLVEEARILVVGETLSNDPHFKIQLIKSLLETSIIEYSVAIEDGKVANLAELQDGEAFVVRSQEIFMEIRSEVDEDAAINVDIIYNSIKGVYDIQADPAVITNFAKGLIRTLDDIDKEMMQEKIDFAGGLEEALGHFWALELNLDENNADLAEIHATHPIAELYTSMKPHLQAADPAFDVRFKTALMELAGKATPDVPRAEANAAIDDLRDMIEEARILVVGEIYNNDPYFKLQLIRSLLETSIIEYDVAIEDGVVVNRAELQDGSAFVWRSQQIFEEIKSEINDGDAASINEAYANLWPAYANTVNPDTVQALTTIIIDRIDVITGGITEENRDFAGGLEEALGHFWALELNLDENNAELAEIHATHPIAELYTSMKPQLQTADPAFDARFETALMELASKATPDVPRAEANAAIDDLRDMIEEARILVVGDTLSADPNFKLLLMKSLLKTSIVEYGVAIEDGEVVNLAELQDGEAFVVRSQAILDEIRADISEGDVEMMDEIYSSLNDAYDQLADPVMVEEYANGIIDIINTITGDNEDAGIQNHIDSIRMLLEDTRTAFANGEHNLAASYAINSYLNHYEFLELPLIDAGEREFMLEVESLMRTSLPDLIRTGQASFTVSGAIDRILTNINVVEDILIGTSGN